MNLFKQNEAQNWFETFQIQLCEELEKIEAEYNASFPQTLNPCFEFKPWTRENNEGGGKIGLLKGQVFEKACINTSTVFGNLSDDFKNEVYGTENSPCFWASGVSVIIHPSNPFVPAAHMNTRFINTEKQWFGGCADLTPTFCFEEDTNEFHQALKDACDTYSPLVYPDYKKKCDNYFYLPHRKEPRGIGGIFFDHLEISDWQKEFRLIKDIGLNFLKIYAKIVRKRMYTPYQEKDKNQQLIKRGRYVEFNLLYDRGTRFGLMTNGNIEAIMMSLPPMALWP